MRKRYRWAAVGTVTLAVAMVAGSAFGMLFDLAGHWAAPLIGALQAKGVVNGTDQGKFEPEGLLTRAQMAKLLVVGLGNEADAQLLAHYDSRFTDIPGSHWAQGFIESLAELGITDGYGDGAFGPEDQVTRAQMAVFLVRAAGLGDQARLMRFEVTEYKDDKAIPEWARGSVQVALSSGLMSGFVDGTFRPLQPITRAEGTVTLFRLLSLKGLVYNLAGTLVTFDPESGHGVVRDDAGQEKSFTMAPDAQYFRAGESASAAQVRLMDQVWIVLGANGTGTFFDARFADDLVTNVSVSGSTITVSRRDGAQRTLTAKPGVLVFVNGAQAALLQADGAVQAYVALDRQNNEVRVIDAVKPSLTGRFGGYDAARGTMFINTNSDLLVVDVTADAILLLNGRRVQPAELQAGDRVMIGQDDAGAIKYLQAER